MLPMIIIISLFPFAVPPYTQQFSDRGCTFISASIVPTNAAGIQYMFKRKQGEGGSRVGEGRNPRTGAISLPQL